MYVKRDGSLILPIVSNAVVVGTTTQTTFNHGIATTTIRIIATTIMGFVVLFRKYFITAGISDVMASEIEQESTDLFLLAMAKNKEKGQIVGHEICPFMRDFLHVTNLPSFFERAVFANHY